MTCARCDNEAMYYTCCGDPVDGSSGHGCDHEGGKPVCDTHWDLAEEDGEVSSASDAVR